MTDCARRRPTLREIAAAFKALRLYGMAGAWVDLTSQGKVGIASSRWLVAHLLPAEHPERARRAVSYPLTSARCPVHRDLAGFAFSHAQVDERLILELADRAVTEVAHHVVCIGGTGTGKSHLATALGVSGITRQGRRVRFFSTVDLVNALEQEQAAGKAGKLARSLMRSDLVILDELGDLPCSQAGGARRFHWLSKRYEHTRVMLTTNLTFGEWASVLGDAKMTTAWRDRLTHHCHIVETGTASYRCRHRSATAKSRIKAREQSQRGSPTSDPF
jgi:DNA replication protein DnaC